MTLEKRVTLVASGSFFLQGAQAPYSSYVTGRWACHLLHGLGGCLRIQLLQRVSNIEFRIIQMFNQFHHTHIVALFVFKWERLTKSDTALMAYQERREASTYGELYSILAQHLDMDYVWRKKMTHEQCSTTPGWLFYYRGLWYRTSHLYWGVFFFSQAKDPYDKHEKLRSPPNTSRMPLWKALFPTRRLGTSHAFVDHAVNSQTPWGLRESVYTTPGAIQDVEDLWSTWIWWETGENKPCWVWCGTLSSNVERQT